VRGRGGVAREIDDARDRRARDADDDGRARGARQRNTPQQLQHRAHNDSMHARAGPMK
jgi:hypothetical protein